MSAVQAPLQGKEYITITGTAQGPVRKKVLFTLQHLDTEYWGCEWHDYPLVINATAIFNDDGEYLIHYSKSMETCNLTPTLASALNVSFLDGLITCERLRLAELDNSALVWENQQLAAIYQTVCSSF
jgi:hypothetical protein